MAEIKNVKDVHLKRKRGRPPKERPPVDDRLVPITDDRIVQMKAKLDSLPYKSAEWEAQRREYFAALLDSKLGVEDRADLLVALAKRDDAKSAPVALRALQDINIATRVTQEQASNVPSIFVLPVGTKVATEPTIIDVTPDPLQLEAGDGDD